ncbi:hypothetical protein LIER_35497 [Lithospermum erythrorhizon]|uniref:Reverse transcriptase RNase H-like domain-containing protein n=1 Tax=Lithospermum erythrorhizon TaxID=34254 RepID=A0AAV3NVI0_LITER
MCTEFTNINKTYPKDCYPLPNIDKLVVQALEFEDPEGGSVPNRKDSSPDPAHIPRWGSEFALLQRHNGLWIFESALSSVLIREEEKVERSVYYGIRVMRGAEARYPLTEKLVYALIVAAQKLKRYFKAHLVETADEYQGIGASRLQGGMYP